MSVAHEVLESIVKNLDKYLAEYFENLDEQNREEHLN
jgi:hypothetical protein